MMLQIFQKTILIYTSMNDKIKKFTQLSSDIENPIFDINVEKIKNGEYEIDSIIDVFLDPKDIKVDEANVINFNTELSGEIKRGELLYVVALLRKKGTTTYSSPAVQAVLKVRIVDIYHGLSYLSKLIK